MTIRVAYNPEFPLNQNAIARGINWQSYAPLLVDRDEGVAYLSETSGDPVKDTLTTLVAMASVGLCPSVDKVVRVAGDKENGWSFVTNCPLDLIDGWAQILTPAFKAGVPTPITIHGDLSDLHLPMVTCFSMDETGDWYCIHFEDTTKETT